VEGLIFQ